MIDQRKSKNNNKKEIKVQIESLEENITMEEKKDN